MICEGWEGLTVDGKFPLLEWLGGWADRCVFLTVRQATHTANIKLIQASGADADACVAKWETAKALPHPCLVEMMETGHYRLSDTDVAYVVMEKADTFLSGLIPRKALDPVSLQEILLPVVDALAFVHEKGFVHGSVKPSSIAQIADDWKLSADEMAPAGALFKMNRDLDTYDAPELGAGTVTAAADIWSLGMIVVEACSQRTPVWDRNMAGDLGVPDWLPHPFQEIARGCLRWDPASRISVENVKKLLAQTPVSSSRASADTSRNLETQRAALQHSEPATTTLSERVAAVRAEENDDTPPVVKARPETASDELTPRSPRLFANVGDQEQHEGRSGFVLFALVALLVIGVVLGIRYRERILPLIAKHQTPPVTQQTPSVTPQTEPPQNPAGAAKDNQEPRTAVSQSVPALPTNQTANPPADAASKPTNPDENSTGTPEPQAQPQVEPRTEATSKEQPEKQMPAPKEAEPTPRVMNAKGAVLKRVLPNVASGAVQSMQRPVQVDVRVSVNSNGAVSSTQCVTQSRGNYWAKVSQEAAQGWKFKPPIRDGQAQASYWMLLFQFDRARTDVIATQLH